MTTQTKVLAVIVLVLLVLDVLLTVATCQRRNAEPVAPRQPSRTPTVAPSLIVVGPIVTLTPSPVRAIRESPTPTPLPTIAPSPTKPIPTATTAAPQVLPKTGGASGCKTRGRPGEHECN